MTTLAAAGIILVVLGGSLLGSAIAQEEETDPCSPFVAATPAAEGRDGHSAPSGGAESPLATPEAGFPDLDLAFIDLMTERHEGAIAMGGIALVQAEHEEIAPLAQQIIDGQRTEQGRLQSWRHGSRMRPSTTMPC